MYQCSTWRHGTVPRNNSEVASSICKECAPKEVALKEESQLINFGFGYLVLTSIPLKLRKLTLPERTFSSNFRKFANVMEKVCAERRDRTRRLWLLISCRNL